MRYVAYAGRESYVESGDDLEQLLSVLRCLIDPTVPEDIAVWEDEFKLVAVVLAEGTVIRFDQPRPAILPFISRRASR